MVCGSVGGMMLEMVRHLGVVMLGMLCDLVEMVRHLNVVMLGMLCDLVEFMSTIF
jgi:hypothetical protein